MSTPPKRALGKGLEALLPSRPAALPAGAAAAGAAEAAPTGKPLELAVDAIERNPYQTRTHFDEEKLAELTASVAASGVVQPIVVRPLPGAAGESARFQLIAGERRWLASKRAGRATVPVFVRAATDAETMEMTVVENLQRADLNPMEQARAFDRLSREFHLTQQQMAERTGKDRASVGNFLRLMKLPVPVQARVEAGELSFGHARALLALEDAAAIEKAAARVEHLHLSVRATENMISKQLSPVEAAAPKAEQPKDPNVRKAERDLRERLGLRVTIEDKGSRGRVIIDYTSIEDFDLLMHHLGTE